MELDIENATEEMGGDVSRSRKRKIVKVLFQVSLREVDDKGSFLGQGDHGTRAGVPEFEADGGGERRCRFMVLGGAVEIDEGRHEEDETEREGAEAEEEEEEEAQE